MTEGTHTRDAESAAPKAAPGIKDLSESDSMSEVEAKSRKWRVSKIIDESIFHACLK